MKIQYGSQWNNDVISYCCIEIARLDTNTVRFVIKDIDNGRVTWTLATSRSQNNCLKCTSSLRKQPTFSDAATGFPTKWCLRKERRNSILMTRHCPELGSASDWSCRVVNLIQPIMQKHYSDLGSDASSVWDFCARFSDVIWRGNQW